MGNQARHEDNLASFQTSPSQFGLICLFALQLVAQLIASVKSILFSLVPLFIRSFATLNSAHLPNVLR